MSDERAAREFEQVVGDLDYPMVIVTAAADPPAGCLVGFHTQATIAPPRYLVCVSKRNRTYRAAKDARVLGIHFLAAGATGLAELFGAETSDEVNKFARCGWRRGPRGVPLLDGCAAWIAGAIEAELDSGDHGAFLVTPLGADGRLDPGDLLRFQAVKGLDPGHEA